MKPRLLSAAALAALLAVTAFATAAFAAPRAELWPVWERHDPASTATVDHGAWQAFLGRYVAPGPDGVNRFDYAGVTAQDFRSLDAYVLALQTVRVSQHNRREQLAYWINLYNALTVKVILDHMPVESITDVDISPGLFSNGPWDAKLALVEGHEVSLNDVEHRILRPIWQDNRVHYAVNCASVGCPDLAATAYTAANVEEMLDNAARDYVNHPRGARFENGRLVVSSIYSWYEADFGGTDAGVVEHLRRHAVGELAAKLAGHEGGFAHDYDWSLNAAVE